MTIGAAVTAFAVIVLSASAPVAANALATGPRLAWSTSPVPGLSPTTPSPALSALSCPSAGTCLAGRVDGAVLLGTQVGQTGVTWVQVAPPSGHPITSLSCAGTALCLAVDTVGDAAASTLPTTPSSWSRSVLEPSLRLIGVSCTTAQFCAVVAENNELFTSQAPATGTWTSSPLPAGSSPTSLSCVSGTASATCLLGEDNGSAFWSASMTKGTPQWLSAGKPSRDAIVSASCQAGTPSVCFALDDQGAVWSWTPALTSLALPIGPSSSTPSSPTWNEIDTPQLNSTVQGMGLRSGGQIACVTSLLCVATDTLGDSIATANPRAPTPSWFDQSMISPPYHPSSTALSCPTAKWCASANDLGSVFVSTSPTKGSWTSQRIEWTSPIRSIACQPGGQCLAADRGGDVIWRTGLTGQWTSRSITSSAIIATSCPSTQLCIVATMSNAILWSTNPFTSNPTWQTTLFPSTVGFVSLSCASTTLCVGIDEDDNAWTSTSPASTSPSWTSSLLNSQESSPISALDCVAPSSCVASDFSGVILTSTNPAKTLSWTRSAATTSAGIESISCSSATWCMAGGSDGMVFTSTSAFASSPSWSQTGQGLTVGIMGLSCESSGSCTAVAGSPETTVDGGITWNDPGPASAIPWPAYSVSCATPLWCVAGGEGTLFLGVGAPPTPIKLSGSVTTSELDLTWREPNASQPDLAASSYLIKVASIEGIAQVIPTPSNATSYRVEGLSPGTRYKVSVAAVDGAMQRSAWSSRIMVRTRAQPTIIGLAAVTSFTPGKKLRLSVTVTGGVPSPDLSWSAKSAGASGWTSLGDTTPVLVVTPKSSFAGESIKVSASNSSGTSNSTTVLNKS